MCKSIPSETSISSKGVEDKFLLWQMWIGNAKTGIQTFEIWFFAWSANVFVQCKWKWLIHACQVFEGQKCLIIKVENICFEMQTSANTASVDKSVFFFKYNRVAFFNFSYSFLSEKFGMLYYACPSSMSVSFWIFHWQMVGSNFYRK